MKFEMRNDVEKVDGGYRYTGVRYIFDGKDITDQPLAPALFGLYLQQATDQDVIDYIRQKINYEAPGGTLLGEGGFPSSTFT